MLNAYEAFWQCIQTGLYTWSPTGSDGIELKTDNDDKDGFTVLAKIDSNGKTLYLVLIEAGETKKCEKKLVFIKIILTH